MINVLDFDNNIKLKFTFVASKLKNMTVIADKTRLLIDSGLDSDMFNIVCGSDPDLNINYFKKVGRPFAYWIGFENDPFSLENELIKKGLTTEETEWAMSAPLQNFAYSIEHDIRTVQSRKEIEDLITVMNTIMPPNERAAIQSYFTQAAPHLIGKSDLVYYVGYVDKKPMSLASIFCDSKLGSIFDVIVLPEFRGQGWGKAMTAKAMLEIKGRGLSFAILTATNDAKFLYKHLGFEEIKCMKVYK